MSQDEIIARYDGYRGAPCNPTYTEDQRAARLEGYRERLEGYRERLEGYRERLEGYRARNRQDITHSQAGAAPLDEARRLFDAGWRAAALFCDREDVAADAEARRVDELTALRKQDTELIRQMLDALENSSPHTDRSFAWKDGKWQNQRTAAITAARARLEGKP